MGLVAWGGLGFEDGMDGSEIGASEGCGEGEGEDRISASRTVEVPAKVDVCTSSEETTSETTCRRTPSAPASSWYCAISFDCL